jgi:hypothetical protein
MTSDRPNVGMPRQSICVGSMSQSICVGSRRPMGLHEKQCRALRGATARALLPRWYRHPRVYMRVQGTMANVAGGPGYNPRTCALGVDTQGAGAVRCCCLFSDVSAWPRGWFKQAPERTCHGNSSHAPCNRARLKTGKIGATLAHVIPRHQRSGFRGILGA